MLNSNRRCGLGIATIFLMVASVANAQAPTSVPVSLDYFIERLQQADMMAAQLRHERDQLRQQVQALTQQLARSKEPEKKREDNK